MARVIKQAIEKIKILNGRHGGLREKQVKERERVLEKGKMGIQKVHIN